MTFGIRLHVWGERACFARPEMKVERVSYDVPTPSAARGLLEAIYWKPEMIWIVDRIHILRRIHFQSFRRNEVGTKISTTIVRRAMRSGDLAGVGLAAADDTERVQRSATILRNVAYLIEAHFDLAPGRANEEAPKHLAMFNRRAGAGQCFHRPCLGTREFPADFALLQQGDRIPRSDLPAEQRDRDLGWMLYDIDFLHNNMSRFFRGRLRDGVLDIASCLADNGLAA